MRQGYRGLLLLTNYIIDTKLEFRINRLIIGDEITDHVESAVLVDRLMR